MKILAALQLKKELSALGRDSEVVFAALRALSGKSKRETVSSGPTKTSKNKIKTEHQKNTTCTNTVQCTSSHVWLEVLQEVAS